MVERYLCSLFKDFVCLFACVVGLVCGVGCASCLCLWFMSDTVGLRVWGVGGLLF